LFSLMNCLVKNAWVASPQAIRETHGIAGARGRIIGSSPVKYRLVTDSSGYGHRRSHAACTGRRPRHRRSDHQTGQRAVTARPVTLSESNKLRWQVGSDRADFARLAHRVHPDLRIRRRQQAKQNNRGYRTQFVSFNFTNGVICTVASSTQFALRHHSDRLRSAPSFRTPKKRLSP
jgi:hypothetical protein